MKISIFLSYPRPYLKKQEEFIEYIKKYLWDRGIATRTLGVTDYDMDEPLTAIRRLMLESNGLLTIAFRRTYIEKGFVKPNTDINDPQNYPLEDQWLTSPWCHIEPAMAFQVGLPILIFREKGVIADGIIEKGITGTYLPEFDLNNDINIYFESEEWKQLIGKWECYVRNVAIKKGCPPQLY